MTEKLNQQTLIPIRLGLLTTAILLLLSIPGHSAIGVEANGASKYIGSDRPIPKEIREIASELENTDLVLSNQLWINLRPLEPQTRALSPKLRGTLMGEALLRYDLELKERFSYLLRGKLGNEQYAETIPIRLWITPERITIYQDQGAVAVTQIRLKLHIETSGYVNEALSQALEEARRVVEEELNTGARFQGLRDVIGLFYCFRIAKESSSLKTSPRIHRSTISQITQAYLRQLLNAPTIGGISIPGDLVETETTNERPNLPYKAPIPSMGAPSYKDYFFTLSDGNNGILPYLFSKDTNTPYAKTYRPSIEEIIETIETQNGTPLPEDIKSALKGKPYPEQLLELAHYAIKNNFLVPKEIIGLCQRMWQEMGKEERERILANLLDRDILLTPEDKGPTLSRRKFLGTVLISAVSFSFPNTDFLIPPTIDAETFLLLDPTTQAKVISQMQRSLTGNLELSLIMSGISSQILLGEFLRKPIESRRDPIRILLTLIRSKAMFLLSREAQTALLRDLFYLANQRRAESYTSKKAKEEILRLCKEVATMARAYPQDTVFACALFVVVNQEHFSSSQINWAIKVVTPRRISQNQIPQLKIVATHITDKLNKIHDEYETSDWQNRCGRFLKRLPTKLTYISIALSEPNLYTATYNLAETFLLSQARSYPSFAHLLKRLDPSRTLEAYFLTALTRRHYDLYHWAKRHIPSPESFIQEFIAISLKILFRDRRIAYEFSPLKDVYVLHALRRFLIHIEPEERDRYLHRIKAVISDDKTPSGQRYLLYFALKDIIDIKKRINLPEEIQRLIRFLERPPYPRDNRLDCLVIYNEASAGYLSKMISLLKAHGFKRTSPNRFVKQAGKTTITFTLQLWKGSDPERFRKTIESGRYDIVFTRHHSYEGKEFAGVGSEKAMPQFIGTKGPGYGDRNNLLAIVLAEEIAKGAVEDLSWEQIRTRLRARLTIDDFIFPDSFLFKLTYLSALLHSEDKQTITPTAPAKVLIVDGGCGGINRIPPYIFNYAKAIYRASRTNNPSRLRERISRAIERIQAGLEKGPIIIPVGATIKKILKLQQEIDEELRREKKDKDTIQTGKAGGIILRDIATPSPAQR